MWGNEGSLMEAKGINWKEIALSASLRSMPGRPYKSSLSPHLETIRALRLKEKTWQQIADELEANHGLKISPWAILKFFRRRVDPTARRPLGFPSLTEPVAAPPPTAPTAKTPAKAPAASSKARPPAVPPAEPAADTSQTGGGFFDAPTGSPAPSKKPKYNIDI